MNKQLKKLKTKIKKLAGIKSAKKDRNDSAKKFRELTKKKNSVQRKLDAIPRITPTPKLFTINAIILAGIKYK